MTLFDTNILVYAHDISENEKRNKGLHLMESVFAGEREGIVTNQILAELFHVLTGSMKKSIDVKKAQEIVNAIISSDSWKKINYSHKTVKRAVNYVEEFNLHFWDALISATMIENNIFTIYTENEKDFKKIPGIKVINPFS